MTQPIPEGFSSITPSLIVQDAAKAVEAYEQAFEAKELDRMIYPETGKIMHTVLQIGNAKIMLSDVFPGMNATEGTSLYLYVPNADQTMTRAVKAGMEEVMAAEDMFWGDRLGCVRDQFGIIWNVATHQRNASREELEQGARDMAEKMKAAA